MPLEFIPGTGTEIAILCCVIGVFSVVQSIFGVGLLVFGTPTLLFLGYSFETILATLLPCSISINLLQVLSRSSRSNAFKKDFFLYCMPFVVIGLGCVLMFERHFNLKPLIGIMMVLTGILRLSGRPKEWFRGVLSHHLKPLLAVMGLVHGTTNMGGGLLTVIAGSLFVTKEEIRTNIAFAYLMMATSQMAVLVIFTPVHVFQS